MAPRRLSATTHALAQRAQSGEWGRALVDPGLCIDDAPSPPPSPGGRGSRGSPSSQPSSGGRGEESPYLRYARAVLLIAREAPLRILPGELVVGSATLLPATRHVTPVYSGGKPIFGSTSHTTIGFDHALRVGYAGLRREIEERLAGGALDPRGVDVLSAMLTCLQAASIWHRRHLDLLEERIAASTGEEQAHYRVIRENLADVPERPARTFHQAVQALWFLFCFQRLCGNWSGLGRVDAMLGPYLRRDLKAGRITLDRAREILAHFWIKGCEWIGAPDAFGGSGDGQYYQNVVLAGVDERGREVANEVTDLVLDVVEELRISDFPIAVRLNRNTPESLLRRIAQVQRLGGGTVAVYNEETVLAGLTRFGYPLSVARRFANDGCWEIIIPGETCFIYRPFDAFLLLQQALGVVGEPAVSPPAGANLTAQPPLRQQRGEEAAPHPDPLPGGEGEGAAPNPSLLPGGEGERERQPGFEGIYAAWLARMAAQVEAIHAEADNFARGGEPAPLLSLLVRDCIARGRDYWDRGARYTVFAPHAGGLPDVANSLLAIRRLVFERGEITLPDLVAALRANWEGYEPLRRHVLTTLEGYGNDNAEADALARRVFDDYLALVGRVREREGVLRPPGVSTFGREVGWRAERGAAAHGYRAGEYLATNFSPTPGSDRRGPTAVLRSYCTLGLERLTNGTALELKVHPSGLRGEQGIRALVSLLRGFVEMGGLFMHVDAVDAETLRAAQAHPEQYRNLAVRISGWSARFVTLNREWQDMAINRTQHATG